MYAEGNAGQMKQMVNHGIPLGRAPTIELRNMHATYAVTWCVRDNTHGKALGTAPDYYVHLLHFCCTGMPCRLLHRSCCGDSSGSLPPGQASFPDSKTNLKVFVTCKTLVYLFSRMRFHPRCTAFPSQNRSSV